ncbi:hypothetical protein N7516_008353 [Penicillium verrucosum]|uniref:uncharacterized protein n=1 Tax=Penicillium verrucosum TaxID=60171 RepID=UPI0025452F40|nr:uncharacterized protein N7516_008353 [Penicillium verrucosum]KAJ5926580.1 hypothetical protein N7516_008353 [Penicillium verrucosum]
MGMTAALIALYLGDNPYSSNLIPDMLRTLEIRMLGLLEEVAELTTEAQMDGWIECRTFHAID